MRPTNQVGRYKMILHGKRSRAINRLNASLSSFKTIFFSFRFELLEYWKRYKKDGLNSLKDLKYDIISIKNDYLYTKIVVDIGPAVTEIVDKKKFVHTKFKFF